MKRAGWKALRVSEIASPDRNSIVGGPFGSDLVSRDYVPNGIPVIRGANMGGGRWVSGDFVYVSEEKAESLAANCAKPGDLVFTQRGTIGQVALVPTGGPSRYLLSQSQMKLTADPDQADALYLFYAFSGVQQQKYIQQNAIRTGVPHTNLGILRETPLLLPPLSAQKKIAEIAGSLDTKIELNNQINAELEAMAKLLYDYWFVQFDFPMTAAQAASLGRPALVGKPYKSSGGKMVHNKDLNQEIPKAWTVDVLQNLSSLIRRGVSPKYVEQGGISVLNQKCIRDQSIQFTEARRHGIELEESHDRLLQHLDVVVNSTGVGTLGRVAFVKRLNESKTTVDSHVTIVRANQKLVSPAYFVWSMLRLQPVIESAAVGSTGQVELSKTYLEQLNLVVPDGDTQSQFTEFATPVIQAIACREKQNQELTQLRDWLLPMLMNGQVTVGT